MGRSLNKSNVNGWIILDKPKGKTSFQAVKEVRRILSAKKAGHAGTLDPLATGILPIALGEATKTIPYLMDSLKAYHFTVRWGEDRDTNDSEGSTIATSPNRPSKTEIKNILHKFKGNIKQTPPKYSALKVNGQRAYKLARANEMVHLAPRSIAIENIELLQIIDQDYAEFSVISGKGAYMRSLARDLGSELDTLGHISALRRLKVGPFQEKDSISLDSLGALAHSPAKYEHLLPIQTALDGIPALDLSGDEADRLRCGRSIPLNQLERNRGEFSQENSLLYATSCGKLVAISVVEGDSIKPVRVLNL